MNTQAISNRLRQHQHQDLAIKEAFLRFQAHHFEEPWERLLEGFIEQEGRVELFPEPYDVSAELAAFLNQGDQPFDHLGAYTYHFAQAGLRQLPQLTPIEKDMVVLVATYNLAVRFQLLDQDGTYYGVSLGSLLAQMNQVHFINVSKVANNLADRISREIDLFILDFEPPVLPKSELTFEDSGQASVSRYGESVNSLNAELPQMKHEEDTIRFEEVDGVVTAYFAKAGEALSSYDRRLGKSQHLETYEKLTLTQKFTILSYFDNLAKQELPHHFHLGEFDEEKKQTPVYDELHPKS